MGTAIGTAPGVEFPIEQSPAPDFPLVSPQGNDFAFHFGHGMEGEMVVNGQSTSLAELAQQGRTTISPIPHNAKIRVRAGKTTFLVSSVARPRRHVMPLFAALDRRGIAVLLEIGRGAACSIRIGQRDERWCRRLGPRPGQRPHVFDRVVAPSLGKAVLAGRFHR